MIELACGLFINIFPLVSQQKSFETLSYFDERLFLVFILSCKCEGCIIRPGTFIKKYIFVSVFISF